MAVCGPIDIGIIGGVGQQLELKDVTELDVRTPYGSTSAGADRDARRQARRLRDPPRRRTRIQPHLVPYCANVWALASLGVTSLITTTAAGGLRDSFPPGVFVVTDQVIDRTSAGR